MTPLFTERELQRNSCQDRRPSEVWAIEVKSGNNVSRQDLTGLKSFAAFFGKRHQPVVIYRGAVEKSVDGVDILSLTAFLKKLR